MPRQGSGKGFTQTPRGYIRITRRGPYYLWYEHRAVMHKLMQDFSYYGKEIPDGFHVHHVDGVAHHNCPENLMLMDRALHDGISCGSRYQCPYTGRYLTRAEAAMTYGTNNIPDWVTEPTEGE
jgi:hypothetical protein